MLTFSYSVIKLCTKTFSRLSTIQAEILAGVFSKLFLLAILSTVNLLSIGKM